MLYYLHIYLEFILHENGMMFSSFSFQLKHLIDVVIKRIGLDCGDRFKADSRKVKFHINGPLPLDSAFPRFTDFEVAHHYLQQVS